MSGYPWRNQTVNGTFSKYLSTLVRKLPRDTIDAHPWRCLKPGCMGHWAIWSSTWSSSWQLCLWLRGWNIMILGFPYNPSHCIVLWRTDALLLFVLFSRPENSHAEYATLSSVTATNSSYAFFSIWSNFNSSMLLYTSYVETSPLDISMPCFISEEPCTSACIIRRALPVLH